MSGRIRTVKPEWLEDEALLKCGSDARVLSIALVLLADDYGRGRFVEPALVGQAFPYDHEPLQKFREAFTRLSGMGYVRTYSVRGQTYFEIRNWGKHQKVQHPGKPRVPPPDEANDALPRETLQNVSGESRETLTPDHDHDHDHDHDQVVAPGTDPDQRPWSAERAAVVFRKLFEERWGTPPSMGGKNVAGFHETVASTAANRKTDPETLFREMLATWFRDAKWAMQSDKDAVVWRRSPYACFVQQWGPLTMALVPNGARKAGPSMAEIFAAKGWVMP